MKHEPYQFAKTTNMTINTPQWMCWEALSRGLVTSALVLAVGVTIPSVALAGNCKDTTRDMSAFTGNPSVDTTVRNKTNRALRVQILSNRIVKKKAKIAPGEEVSHLEKLTGAGNQIIEFRVNFWYAGDGEEGREFPAYCIYQISTSGSANKLTWEPLQDPICRDLNLSDAFSCDKSYRSGKARYNTVFTVTD